MQAQRVVLNSRPGRRSRYLNVTCFHYLWPAFPQTAFTVFTKRQRRCASSRELPAGGDYFSSWPPRWAGACSDTLPLSRPLHGNNIYTSYTYLCLKERTLLVNSFCLCPTALQNERRHRRWVSDPLAAGGVCGWRRRGCGRVQPLQHVHWGRCVDFIQLALADLCCYERKRPAEGLASC